MFPLLVSFLTSVFHFYLISTCDLWPILCVWKNTGIKVDIISSAFSKLQAHSLNLVSKAVFMALREEVSQCPNQREREQPVVWSSGVLPGFPASECLLFKIAPNILEPPGVAPSMTAVLCLISKITDGSTVRRFRPTDREMVQNIKTKKERDSSRHRWNLQDQYGRV